MIWAARTSKTSISTWLIGCRGLRLWSRLTIGIIILRGGTVVVIAVRMMLPAATHSTSLLRLAIPLWVRLIGIPSISTVSSRLTRIIWVATALLLWGMPGTRTRCDMTSRASSWVELRGGSWGGAGGLLARRDSGPISSWGWFYTLVIGGDSFRFRSSVHRDVLLHRPFRFCCWFRTRLTATNLHKKCHKIDTGAHKKAWPKYV